MLYVGKKRKGMEQQKDIDRNLKESEGLKAFKEERKRSKYPNWSVISTILNNITIYIVY